MPQEPHHGFADPECPARLLDGGQGGEGGARREGVLGLRPRAGGGSEPEQEAEGGASGGGGGGGGGGGARQCGDLRGGEDRASQEGPPDRRVHLRHQVEGLFLCREHRGARVPPPQVQGVALVLEGQEEPGAAGACDGAAGGGAERAAPSRAAAAAGCRAWRSCQGRPGGGRGCGYRPADGCRGPCSLPRRLHSRPRVAQPCRVPCVRHRDGRVRESVGDRPGLDPC
mmetsp:Transcript_558/g.1930  ORF Transcript_558/g.1930 Transcript_558/m.1930 type:complete len:227 (+) Transcript_558:2348-3028(+)